MTYLPQISFQITRKSVICLISISHSVCICLGKSTVIWVNRQCQKPVQRNDPNHDAKRKSVSKRKVHRAKCATERQAPVKLVFFWQFVRSNSSNIPILFGLQSLKNRSITEFEERTTSSASQNSFGGEVRPFHSIREKILADIERYDRRFDDLTQSPPMPFDDDHMRAFIPVPALVVDSCDRTALHSKHHHNHHCDSEYFNRFAHSADRNRLLSPRAPCSSTTSAITKNNKVPESKSLSTSPQSNLKRSKSCPKDLFSSTNDASNENPKKLEPSHQSRRRLVRSNISPESTSNATLPCRKKCGARTKAPVAIDKFLTSKMVRSNLAASLRQQWAHKKITEMTDKRMTPPPPAQVTKYIPKCHRWNVRDTPAWKSFRLEEWVQTEPRWFKLILHLSKYRYIFLDAARPPKKFYDRMHAKKKTSCVIMRTTCTWIWCERV